MKYFTIPTPPPQIFYFPPSFSQVAQKFFWIPYKIITKITQKSEKYLRKHTFKFPKNFSNSFLIECYARIIRICVVSNHFCYWHGNSLSEILENFQRNFAGCFFGYLSNFFGKIFQTFLGFFDFAIFLPFQYEWELSILIDNCPWSIWSINTYRYFIVLILPITNANSGGKMVTHAWSSNGFHVPPFSEPTATHFYYFWIPLVACLAGAGAPGNWTVNLSQTVSEDFIS